MRFVIFIFVSNLSAAIPSMRPSVVYKIFHNSPSRNVESTLCRPLVEKGCCVL
ncbi:hypothetical protein M758_12G190200 [Ceratodon purpureus]|uniref:Uncharacterized protein n=1 Tax=Ceratodon purpureus TaxID=3225 RepID=A0A8T0G992_CERPU|nr:hypothetical protein KC19_12G186400 [Ceratodon purpureus]KAG0599948.1 hypothetical protein M758_12G190200 [Ceratodon purpureus]